MLRSGYTEVAVGGWEANMLSVPSLIGRECFSGPTCILSTDGLIVAKSVLEYHAGSTVPGGDRMAQCAACGKNILMGGVKEGEARYCNQTCRGNAFIERFNAALERASVRATEPLPAAQPSSSEGPEATADSDSIARGAGELGVSGAGLAVGAAVVALIWFIHEKVNYPFFAQTVWFVIPIGAFFCGMVAGLGFFLGIRLFNRRPSKLTFAVAGLSGLAGYILIFGLSWWFTEVGGLKVRDVVGFPQFLQAVVENQRVQFRHAPRSIWENGDMAGS